MSITISKEGKRFYLAGNTFQHKERLKEALGLTGKNFDAARKSWWVDAGKAAQAEALVAELNALPRAVGADKPRQDPDSLRLTGKGLYKGRTYYLGATNREGTRVRCLTLPNADGNYLDFWADKAQVEVVKSYAPREYRWRTEYTTLGSIASFIYKQREARASGVTA